MNQQNLPTSNYRNGKYFLFFPERRHEIILGNVYLVPPAQETRINWTNFQIIPFFPRNQDNPDIYPIANHVAFQHYRSVSYFIT